eukprot:s2129_g9.t1
MALPIEESFRMMSGFGEWDFRGQLLPKDTFALGVVDLIPESWGTKGGKNFLLFDQRAGLAVQRIQLAPNGNSDRRINKYSLTLWFRTPMLPSKADRMLLLDLPRGEMESEEETATGGTSSVFVWRGGVVAPEGYHEPSLQRKDADASSHLRQMMNGEWRLKFTAGESGEILGCRENMSTMSSTGQGLHDLSRMALWASTALATGVLWSQKPEACVKCNTWANFDNTEHMPLVFDCPWCGTRNAHPGHRFDLPYNGRPVWCQKKQCDKKCRIKRPCHARIHAGIGISATGLGLVGAVVCPPLAVGAGLTGGVYRGAMGIAEDRPGQLVKAVATTASLGLSQFGDQAASTVAHTINASLAIHSLVEACQNESWLGVTLSIVSFISSTVQLAQSLDQAALQETEEALEVARKQVSNLGREVQQGGPIQHGARIEGKFYTNLQQAATARDQIKVMYDHQFMSLKEKEWLLERLNMLNKLGKGTQTLDDIICSIKELEAQKPNVAVERN